MSRAAKKRKAKGSRKNAIKVDDVVFATLVHDEKATIVASEGRIGLVVQPDPEAEGPAQGTRVFLPPQGVRITAEMFDQEVDITVRDITEEVILQLGEDDYYEDELEQDSRLMAVESTDDLQELYNEKKIQLFSKLAGTASTLVSGCLLSFVSVRMLGREFPFPPLLYVGAVAGVTLGILFGVIPCFKIFRHLSSKWVVDCENNYINMETGSTNLNGGMRLPVGRS